MGFMGRLRAFSAQHKYGVIYADPPKSLLEPDKKSSDLYTEWGYDRHSFDELAELPVASLAARNCALFLWAPDRLLPSAIRLIQGWGFEYNRIALCWAPSRARDEVCLLATRGRPIIRAENLRPVLWGTDSGGNAETVRAQIEGLATGPYLDLFAKEVRPGWHHCSGSQSQAFENTAGAMRTHGLGFVDELSLMV